MFLILSLCLKILHFFRMSFEIIKMIMIIRKFFPLRPQNLWKFKETLDFCCFDMFWRRSASCVKCLTEVLERLESDSLEMLSMSSQVGWRRDVRRWNDWNTDFGARVLFCGSFPKFCCLWNSSFAYFLWNYDFENFESTDRAISTSSYVVTACWLLTRVASSSFASKQWMSGARSFRQWTRCCRCDVYMSVKVYKIVKWNGSTNTDIATSSSFAHADLPSFAFLCPSFEVWRKFQINWCRLEHFGCMVIDTYLPCHQRQPRDAALDRPIFMQSDDIRSQLPEDSKRFEMLDNSWKDT